MENVLRVATSKLCIMGDIISYALTDGVKVIYCLAVTDLDPNQLQRYLMHLKSNVMCLFLDISGHNACIFMKIRRNV